VDYYTPTGEIDCLPDWVMSHPLECRIAWLQVQDRTVSVGIKPPREVNKLVEKLREDDNAFDRLWAEFQRWLKKQGKLPAKIPWQGKLLPVSYSLLVSAQLVTGSWMLLKVRPCGPITPPVPKPHQDAEACTRCGCDLIRLRETAGMAHNRLDQACAAMLQLDWS
jgi:hypothetical protein